MQKRVLLGDFALDHTTRQSFGGKEEPHLEPNTCELPTTFGQARATRDPRQAQFGLKLIF